MDRIDLKVTAVTGHYTQPGSQETMGLARSYPIAPPSTMAGFVESLCGAPLGAFRSSGSTLAYGWASRPTGHAILLQRMHTLASQPDPVSGKSKMTESTRPYHRECLVNMTYRITVRGPFADRIRRALDGDVDRTGVLSLGDSDDMVDWITESTEPAEWLVPGTSLRLPTRVPRNYACIQAEKQSFDLTPLSEDVPDTAWMSPGGKMP